MNAAAKQLYPTVIYIYGFSCLAAVTCWLLAAVAAACICMQRLWHIGQRLHICYRTLPASRSSMSRELLRSYIRIAIGCMQPGSSCIGSACYQYLHMVHKLLGSCLHALAASSQQPLYFPDVLHWLSRSLLSCFAPFV